MKVDRSTLLLVLAALAIGYWFAGPEASPRPDRPVARWIARAAKNALWFMLVAEPPPAAERSSLVHGTHVGEDGYQVVDHGKGW